MDSHMKTTIEDLPPFGKHHPVGLLREHRCTRAVILDATLSRSVSNHDLGARCMARETLELFPRERMEIAGRLGERRCHAPIFISLPLDDNPAG
jgi:hypothetical protein